MAFGQQPSGPPASAKQVQQLLSLVRAAGHVDFRDARGALGLTQRQAGGKFSRDEAEVLCELVGRCLVHQVQPGGLLEDVERGLHLLEPEAGGEALLGDLLGVLDHNGRLLQFNQSANALTGYAAAAVIGQPWTDFVPLEQQANFQRMLDSVLDGDHQIWESSWRHRDGAWLLLELGATRMAGMATEPGVQLIARDVGARTAAQRMRSEFMAAVSHELRTPLSSVMGYAELLTTGMAGELTGEQTEYAGIILKNTQRMQRLVNDLLEVSKLEAGQLALNVETVDLSMLASGVVDALRPLLNADGMQIEVDLAPDLPAVHGDQPRLEQVLTNLLANASKYSPSGGLIRLVGYRHAPAADPLRLQLALPANASGWAIIAVIDQGMGIPPADIPGLFHRFHRGQTARAQRVDGSGLGLYLARSIVEASGGELILISDEGQGTSVIIRFPLIE